MSSAKSVRSRGSALSARRLDRPRLLLLAAALVASACARRAEPPAPGTSQGVPPDLRGRRVMVLPVQVVQGVRGDADAELAFGLAGRAPSVDWILPPELERALERAPSVRTRTRGLSVSAFLSAEVHRVGDPLYGELLRLAALVDAEAALVPIEALAASDSLGEPRTRLSATLIHVRSGRVLWFGMVEGAPAPPDDPAALASAVDAMARRLLWYVSG